MNIKIKNCSLSDVTDIMALYQAARELQTEREMVVWPYFEDAFLKKEINENRQWKITFDGTIACNWTITFEDKEIWGIKDKNDSIYIHRICTNPELRGNRYIDEIVKWSREYAKQEGKRFVRLDTLGNNIKLIEHYTSAGFNFLGMVKLTDTEQLPAHYQNERNCCLFELDVWM
ncbi:GNAT family N-acetyltransferase [Chryseobacterium sp. MEBOG06]|uniref:GNAT family N-acetyltransferase n=1 Tax=unclassified Chryseobacterium TaxID=2593645 RepID=UPI001F471D5C|nr:MULTISPECIES: GNAT family N-acetyltransferase [unclassified Chryseobacterium]UKB85762.1 GNAT family N-acetyltransferase [Chryseobacterium sp. MEBOG06]